VDPPTRLSVVSESVLTDPDEGDNSVKPLLAEQLLAEVLGVSDLEILTELVQQLRTLATLKYDDYEGYGPGVRFIESLAIWLAGFAPVDRRKAVDFVTRRLTYVSAVELDHMVSTVYPDILRPRLVRLTAQRLGVDAWRIRTVANDPMFTAEQRRTLILGMSDGARLDKLRRFSPLSNEQFHQVTVLDDEKAQDMGRKLKNALEAQNLPGEATFSSVVVVDDFSGSGTTMLRPEDDGSWSGKLPKIQRHIKQLQDKGHIAANAGVLVVLYLMTSKAQEQLNARMTASGLDKAGYELISAHTFTEDFPLSESRDKDFLDLCDRYFQKTWAHDHMNVGGRGVARGFGGSALPLVLHHNAPNNAPPILWKDESDELSPGDGTPWAGVFPRHERHHPGRP
jgi:hypothetical protein